MGKLILLRHGKSAWNQANIFTGWVDIPLAKEGIEEAMQAGEQLAEHAVDLIFTSTLVRAMQTAVIALASHPSGRIPFVRHCNEEINGSWYEKPEGADLIEIVQAWQLNERMYGDLQGKNKQKLLEEVGEKQFKLWRRSYDQAPPNGESLKMTAKRTLPYFKETIFPHLESGKSVLIAAHGNSLRALVMWLDGLSEEEVVKLEIPTGQPLIYRFEEGRFALL